MALAIGYLAAHLVAAWQGTPPGIASTIGAIEPVLLVLAASNLIVLLAVNPFREDRLPSHMPAILQDAITVGIFAIVVVLFFNDRLQLTAAAGAVVLGLALQDTLGHAMAGLALQADQPYRAGDWIRVGDHEGRVMQISWRSTVLRTRDNTLVMLPNSSIADGVIVNYSAPAPPTRVAVEVGVRHEIPPNLVKAAIDEALAQVPLALAAPAPDALVAEIDASAVVYRARCFVSDMEQSSLAQDQMRAAIWYAFQRRGVVFAHPVQVEYGFDARPRVAYPEPATLARLIEGSRLLGALTADARERLARSARPRLFGAGERIVRQGDAGGTSFLVASGTVRVSMGPDDREVATLGEGDMFGEMSWLTGDARAATVTAASDVTTFELDGDVLRDLASASPGVLESLAEAVSRRRLELESISADTSPSHHDTPEASASLVARMKRFLRLGG